MAESFPVVFPVTLEDAGARLDQFLVGRMAGVSRARIQQLIEQEMVVVDDQPTKASLRLRGGENVKVRGPVEVEPLRAMPECIPLDVVYEDDDLAIINKPAGMMVHAGAGATDDARNRGTLVNALLHRFGRLSEIAGEIRPGIVHRLDKETSGLIVIAKNDQAHRNLAAQFARRQAKKTYIALVHGWLKAERGTVNASISRDRVRRTRMTTRGSGGREAITHYTVQRRIGSDYGRFTLLELRIDTGRTHQIRVHLSSLGHPIVGDRLYGARTALKVHAGQSKTGAVGKKAPVVLLGRNFLHAAALELQHPRTGARLSFSRGLPSELETFLQKLEAPAEC